MKKTYLLLWLAMHNCIVFAQVKINFENGDLSQWQQWPENQWNIEKDHNDNHWLWHSTDNIEHGSAIISIPVNLDVSACETNWKFQLRHGYNPSSSNHWAIILLSDASGYNFAPGNHINGYAIGVNINDNNDLLSLYRIDNGNYITILSTINWQERIGTDQPAGISVNRSVSGLWILKIDDNGNFDSLETIGNASDNKYRSGLFFGIYYKYSSSQDMKLWFDDLTISGEFINDKSAPHISTVIPLNDSVLEINFNEPVQYQLSEISDRFVLNKQYLPDSIIPVSSKRFQLIFSEKFRTDNTIEIKNISDFFQNIISDTVINFIWYVPVMYDIIITEIMSSPVPSMGLPGTEYIELYNRSSYPVKADKWELCIDNRCREINFIIDENKYLIVCDKEDSINLSMYGDICNIENLYTLPNEKAIIELKNNKKQIIHYVEYISEWYNSSYKKEGGWSLEIIDTKYPCVAEENWSSSINPKGGTPGINNSISNDNPDFKNPSLIRVSVISDTILKLFFSENMDNTYLYDCSYFQVEGIGNPIKAELDWPGNSSVILTFNQHFNIERTYFIKVDDKITDCAGNQITNNISLFAVPVFPDSNNLVINEILFDAIDYGAEFIEIYNRSQHTINLDNIRLATRENYTGELKNITTINEEGYLLFPGDYFAITNNLENLLLEYNVIAPEKVYKNKLPSLPNDESSIVICDINLNILDLVYYSNQWHYFLLSSTKGVSLERINPDVSSLQRSNWHSASSTSGYATPGYKNSQYLTEASEKNIVQIEPEVFSPDNDGYNDLLQIHIYPGKEGYTCQIKIYDSRGRLNRFLTNNILLGTENVFIWDGLKDSGTLASIGMYIVFIRLFNLEGEILEFKKSCVLGGKIN